MAVSLTLSPEQADLLRTIIPSLPQQQNDGTPRRMSSPLPLRRRSSEGTSRRSSVGSFFNSSADHSVLSSEVEADTDTDQLSAGEQGYSTDEMFTRKLKNSKGTEAQKYLLV